MAESRGSQQFDEWADHIHRSGLAVVALPLLHICRAAGFVLGQAVLLSQPLLNNLIAPARLNHLVALLDDPVAIDTLIAHVEQKAESDG